MGHRHAAITCGRPGRRSYQLAAGTLALDAVWNDPVIPVFAMAGTVSGTVVLPPPTPAIAARDTARHEGSTGSAPGRVT